MLQHTAGLSLSLQNVDTDLIRASDQAKIVIRTLEDKRNNQENWDSLFSKATEISNSVDVAPSIPRQAKYQRHRNNVPHESVEEYWKRSTLLPFLDHLISELRTRLITPSPLFKVQALLPQNVSESSNLEEDIFESYLEDLPDKLMINSELQRWKFHWMHISEDERPANAVAAINSVTFAHYPNIMTALKIFATLPVTSSTVERSFSAMRRLKTFLRNKMSNDRMSALALMHIYREDEIDYDACLRKFSAGGLRRIVVAFDS